jgi:hypothetical protein
MMPKPLFLTLCAAFAFLWLVSVGQSFCIYALHLFTYDQRYGGLDVDMESSYYTWLSTCALFVTAFMAFRRADYIGKGGPYFRQWVGVGVLFVYLSADEAQSIHEKLGSLGAMMVNPTGYFFLSWTVPGMILVAIVSLALISMVIALPPYARWMSIASGAVFLSGAVGLEMIGGNLMEIYGFDSVPYALETSAEEALEGLGVLMFLWTLIWLERREGRRSPA